MQEDSKLLRVEDDEIPTENTVRYNDDQEADSDQPAAQENQKDNSPTPQDPEIVTLSLGDYIKVLEPMTELTWQDKAMLIKIYKLSNGIGCTVGNEKLGQYLGIPYNTVIKIIKRLTDDKYLVAKNNKGKIGILCCSSKRDYSDSYKQPCLRDKVVAFITTAW